MADNEVKIYITTEADLSDAQELQAAIEEAKEKVDELRSQQLQLQFEADTQAVEDAENEIEELKALIEAAESDPVHVNVDGEEIEAAKDRVNELEQSLLDLQATAANSELNMLKDLADDADNAKSSIDGVTESASGLEGAMGAVAGAAAAGGLMEMVDTAGNINDSWNRLELTFGSVSDSMKQSISSVADETGRSGGTIRNYFNQMGIAGVTNTDLLSQSFEALSGRAYQTGASIETMENVMQRMVLSGNAGARQLTQLGISTEDLGRAMGVSADEATKAFQALSQEDRLRVLTQAMGDGKKANEEYKNSWQGVKDQASAAAAGLMGAVGTPILQMLIPVMQTATRVVKLFTDGFKQLPGPLQSVIGGIGAGVAIFTAFAGAIGVAGQVIGGLKSGIEIIRSLSAVSKVLSAVRTVLTAVNSALAVSEWATLLPILLVAAAIIALIAILWYLYNTNEGVRNAIDSLGQTLWGIGETIYGALTGAFQWLSDQFQWLSDSFWGVVNTITTYAPLIAQVLFIMATGGVGAIVLLVANFMGMPNQVGGALQSVIERAIKFVEDIVGKLGSGAKRAVDSFLAPFKGVVDAIASELSAVYDTVMGFIQPIIDAFNQLGSAASWAFSILGLGQGSPGNIFRATKRELTYVEDYATGPGVRQMIKAGSVSGSALSDSFNPVLDYEFSNAELVSGTVSANRGNGESPVSYTFNLYGDIDNEERMQRFVDEVRRQIDWVNATAGRDMEVR